jgi:hypothetical protein
MPYSIEIEVRKNTRPIRGRITTNTWNVYRIKADSFLELITAIDEIDEEHLGFVYHSNITRSSHSVEAEKIFGKWETILNGHPETTFED